MHVRFIYHEVEMQVVTQHDYMVTVLFDGKNILIILLSDSSNLYVALQLHSKLGNC